MKFRTDFVTNSSSSSFFVLRFETKDGRVRELESEAGNWQGLVDDFSYTSREIEASESCFDLAMTLYEFLGEDSYCLEEDWIGEDIARESVHSLKKVVLVALQEDEETGRCKTLDFEYDFEAKKASKKVNKGRKSNLLSRLS